MPLTQSPRLSGANTSCGTPLPPSLRLSPFHTRSPQSNSSSSPIDISFPPSRLAYQSIGVIYGDIGTSPLYVYSSTFSSEPSYDDLLGALSLIIWTLTLMVSVKYIAIVLRADDEGEGGTFAVYSLLSRFVCLPGCTWLVNGMGNKEGQC